MKNSYIKPLCVIERAQMECSILSGSILPDGNGIITKPGGSNGVFDDNTINSKGHDTWSAWDKEWDTDYTPSNIWDY